MKSISTNKARCSGASTSSFIRENQTFATSTSSLLSNIMLPHSINHWTLTSRHMVSKAMLNKVISYQCRRSQRQPFLMLLVIRVIKYWRCFSSQCRCSSKLLYKGKHKLWMLPRFDTTTALTLMNMHTSTYAMLITIVINVHKCC